MAVIGANCPSEVPREHLEALEAELLVFDNVDVGSEESKEVIRLGSHGRS